jgi:hypothetical protein
MRTLLHGLLFVIQDSSESDGGFSKENDKVGGLTNENGRVGLDGAENVSITYGYNVCM